MSSFRFSQAVWLSASPLLRLKPPPRPRHLQMLMPSTVSTPGRAMELWDPTEPSPPPATAADRTISTTARGLPSPTVLVSLSTRVSPPASEVQLCSDILQSITSARDPPSPSSPTLSHLHLTSPPPPPPVGSPGTGRERPNPTVPEWPSIPSE